MDALNHLPIHSTALEALSAQDSADTDVGKVAKDFEALFVSMMLKTMRESMSAEMFAGDGSDTFGGMFDSFLGEHIANSGGIGLTSLFQGGGEAMSAMGTKSLNAAMQNTQLDGRYLEAYANAVAIGD